MAGHADCLQALMRAGVNIKAKLSGASPDYSLSPCRALAWDLDGRTALEVVTQAGHKDCLQIMMRAGAGFERLNVGSNSMLPSPIAESPVREY